MRKTVIGLVTSTKRNKTIRVEVPRLVRHPKYGKYLRRQTVCHAHDERQEARLGDTVELVASRPLSKTKHWELLRIVSRASAERSVAPEVLPAEISGPEA